MSILYEGREGYEPIDLEKSNELMDYRTAGRHSSYPSMCEYSIRFDFDKINGVNILPTLRNYALSKDKVQPLPCPIVVSIDDPLGKPRNLNTCPHLFFIDCHLNYTAWTKSTIMTVCMMGNKDRQTANLINAIGDRMMNSEYNVEFIHTNCTPFKFFENYDYEFKVLSEEDVRIHPDDVKTIFLRAYNKHIN